MHLAHRRPIHLRQAASPVRTMFSLRAEISTAGSYAAGGVFASSGSGNVTGGALDTNKAGTVVSNAALGTCPYTVDSVTGRIDLKIFAGTWSLPRDSKHGCLGICRLPVHSGPSTDDRDRCQRHFNRRCIPTVEHSGVNDWKFCFQRLRTGLFPQRAAIVSAGNHRASHSKRHWIGSGHWRWRGNLDINTFSSTFPNDTISPATSTLSPPATTTGRGTMVLNGTSPNVTYTLVYYPINGSTALLFDQDKTRIATGIIALQF